MTLPSPLDNIIHALDLPSGQQTAQQRHLVHFRSARHRGQSEFAFVRSTGITPGWTASQQVHHGGRCWEPDPPIFPRNEYSQIIKPQFAGGPHGVTGTFISEFCQPPKDKSTAEQQRGPVQIKTPRAPQPKANKK